VLGSFFCDFEFHGEAPDQTLQLGDPVEVLLAVGIAAEQGLGTLEKVSWRAPHDLILQLVVTADLGHGLGAGQQLKHDLCLKLGRKATLLGHDEPP
jgi:hypothetical protein